MLLSHAGAAGFYSHLRILASASCLPGGRVGDSSNWVAATHLGDLGSVTSSQLLGQILAQPDHYKAFRE